MSKSSALGSLKLSLDVSNQYGIDSSEGIGVTNRYDEVNIGVNSTTNRYEKTSESKESLVKKDINARADELAFYENQLAELKSITKVADRKLFNATESINEKKNQIVTITQNAVGCGCSSTITDASITTNSGTVSIGIGSTVITDRPVIKTYSNLSTNNDNPFQEDNTITMTKSDLGEGYETQYEENSSEGVILTTTHRELTGNVTPFFGGECDAQDCSNFKQDIINLAEEINTIRGTIDNQLISDTNVVKDKKTEVELFIWSYKNTDSRIQEDKDSTENAMRVIENQNGFE